MTTGIPELLAETRISGDEVESSRETDLVGALRRVPGLAGVRRGAVNLDPVVRGLQETEVAALVDGTRTFAAGPARMDSELSHVSPHAVETVEVVKGPYALTWGPGALSAIRIETHRPPFRTGGYQFGGRAGYRFGENGSAHDGHARLWGAGERTRFDLNLGARAGGAVSARLPLGEHWSLSAGAGRAVRTASVLERYSDRFPSTKFQIASEFVGQPGLPPEAAFQIDLGLAYRRPGLSASATLFRRIIDDYITVAPDPELPKRLPLSPPVVYRYVSGEQARSWGGELQVAHEAARWLS